MQGDQALWQSLAAVRVADLDRVLEASGELVGRLEPAGPERAWIVQARERRAPSIGHAPFPLDRVFLVAGWIVDCDDPERAVDVAALVSAWPGPGRAPLNVPVELRPLMTKRAPGDEM
jgi:hypothetical protein